MGKTSKLLRIAVMVAAIVFLLAGCGNPAMEPNETEYMYSGLSIEKAVWELTSMSGMGGMTTLHIMLSFDEPVRSDRASGAWTPFTVNFDYSGGSPLIISPQSPDVDGAFTRTRGEEKTLYYFSITFNGAAEGADKFSNVRLSYMAPANTKIVGLSGAELKDFMNKPVTQKGAGDGMGGH
jgi:hypothetical protein